MELKRNSTHIFATFVLFLLCIQLQAQATIQRPTILNCTLDTTGQATFCVQNGKAGSIVVEYFLWNRWVRFDTVCTVSAGHDTCVSVTYQLHTGLNQLRFFIDDRIASTYDVTSSSGKCTVRDSTFHCGNTPHQNDVSKIQLARATYWELHDERGNMVRRGRNSSVSKAGLSKGTYKLYYENCSMEFFVSE